VDHILLHCKIACALWNTIFNSIGLAWVMPSWVVDLFACLGAQGGRPQFVTVWKMMPSCLMWCHWRERNGWSFEDHERTLVELKALFFKTLYHWVATFDFDIF
jgi:hypothetical protein